MANIGSFKKSGNEYQGEIVTLSAANTAMCALLSARPGQIADCDLMDHILPADFGDIGNDRSQAGGAAFEVAEVRARSAVAGHLLIPIAVPLGW